MTGQDGKEAAGRPLSVAELTAEEDAWRAFLEEKTDRRQMGHQEADAVREWIDRGGYLSLAADCRECRLPAGFPVKHLLNKTGTRKKRIVYSFEGEEGIFLKFVAWQLHRYDRHFSGNCYAFRKHVGVKEAIRRICREAQPGDKYCLKVDISNYFNSIDVDILLQKLAFVREEDAGLYRLFERMLRQPFVWENGEAVPDRHGAMAGIPVAPFFANVYLAETDAFFEREDVLYFRYSDDILIFAGTRRELEERQKQLYTQLRELCLTVNPEKVKTAGPGEYWEFLGFGYRDGQIDLSEGTIRKTKAKIRRKADALRRWQRDKNLTSDKAAIGLIHAMNRKFYGSAEEGKAQENDFTWCRWFLPNLDTDKGLRIIDEYMQEYIRYTVTGRHYKGNYRIGYETLKKWGYRSLVHEFWEGRKR